MAPDPDPPAPEPALDPVESLLETCLARMESEGPSAADDLCRSHPAHADALRRRLALIEGAGFMDRSVDGELPERLDEFELIRRIGSGGMGVVYLARQASLGREVALKLVRPEQLFFPGARERFRREVDAVARMQHPGIVAVHAVGEAVGIPYFAMEHIAGASLAEVLRRVAGRSVRELAGADLRRAVAGNAEPSGTLPGDAQLFAGSWVNVCLRLVRSAAEAVHHAHTRGVLHRDLKPSNLMVTLAGRVVVLDFGLASSEGADRVTRSGQQVGSLPYMAPEQVRGDSDRVDARTDVYALGVTLYELLTLRAPYLGRNAEATRTQIFAGDALRPRDLNPAVPWEVETVTLKAMDCDPAQRYASAEELLQDLTNCLELRPILASRPGFVRRARRFVQRHPAKATAVALGALILVGGPTVYVVTQQMGYRAVERALHRAEASSDRARRAADELLTQVAGDELAHDPFMDPQRRKLLERALELYRELAGELDENQATARRQLAAAHGRIGQLFTVLGHADQSLAALQRASELLAPLIAAAPADPTLRHEAATLLLRTAAAHRQRHEDEQALAAADRALEQIMQLPAAVRAGAACGLDAAAALDRKAMALIALGRHAAAVAPLDQATLRLEPLLAEQPDNLEAAGELSLALALRCECLTRVGAATSAIPLAQRALALAERASAARPGSLDVLDALRARQVDLGMVLARAGARAQAIQVLDLACDQATRTLAEYPDYPAFRVALARALHTRGELHLASGSNAYAEVDFQAALVHLENVLLRRPEDALLRIELSHVHLSHAETLNAEGATVQAEAAERQGAAIAHKLLQQEPTSAPAALALLRALTIQGVLQLRHGGASEHDAIRVRMASLVRQVGAESRDELRSRLREVICSAGGACLDAAAPAEAARLAALLLGLDVQHPEDGLAAAALLVRCAEVARGASPDEPAAGEAHLAQAVAALAEAVAAGAALERVAGDAAFGALRQRSDYQALSSAAPRRRAGGG